MRLEALWLMSQNCSAGCVWLWRSVDPDASLTELWLDLASIYVHHFLHQTEGSWTAADGKL